MPFYLRKALSFGPIRLNLSKHGVGVSGGVTGARLGMGPKGTYVHGGRHGLYYRKHFSGSKERTGVEGRKRGRTDGEERYFVDTGVTYGSDSGSNPERKRPSAPSLPGLEKPGIAAFISSLLLLIGNFSVIGGIGLVGLGGSLLLIYRVKKDKEATQNALQKLKQGLDDRKEPSPLLQELEKAPLSEKARHYVEFHFYRDFLDRFLDDPEYPTPEQFKELEEKLGLSEQVRRQEKLFAFSALLDEVLEDHVIDAEEEEQLENLQKSLGLSDDDISEEKSLIRTMTEMRKALEEEMEPLEVDVKLKEDEKCYFTSEGRFLKENIQEKFQRNRIVYKAIGYEVDLEGTLYLTDKRILIVGRGSRDYDLEDVLDVTLSLQENILELVLDGRKNPVIVTTPRTAVLSGKLERLIGEDG